MARAVIRLNESELKYFHDNYNYMWKKLNTAPYYVSGFGESPSWIRGAQMLPSYVNLSKCMNPDYIPSMNLVNKIVHFYNANIAPTIDTYAFLHEALELGDRSRTALACVCLEPYCGIYYGYYFSEAEDDRYIHGALLNVFQSDGELRCRLLYGLTADEDLQDPGLRQFIEPDSRLESFPVFKQNLPLSKSLIALFSGSGKISPGIMSMNLQRTDCDGEYLSLQLPTGSNNRSGDYIGGLGTAFTITADRSFQLYRFGLERAEYRDLRPLSLADPKLRDMLSLHKGRNERILMAPSDNTSWTNYLILRTPLE